MWIEILNAYVLQLFAKLTLNNQSVFNFVFWLLWAFDNTKIESDDLKWGFVLMGLFQKQIHESSFFWQLSVANIIICFQTFFRWKLRSCLNYPSTLKMLTVDKRMSSSKDALINYFGPCSIYDCSVNMMKW